MTDQTKHQLKLLLFATTTLLACLLSYVFFAMVSWKLVVGIILAHLSRMEYERLVKELEKNHESNS